MTPATPRRLAPRSRLILLAVGLLAASCSSPGQSASPGATAPASSGTSSTPGISIAPGTSAGSPATSAEPSASVEPAGRTLTLADDGTTLSLAVGERFLLMLGVDYDWTVSLADPSVVDRVRNVSVLTGAQGLYEAKAPGRTTISATGDPPCRKSTPPCGAPSRLFSVYLVVR